MKQAIDVVPVPTTYRVEASRHGMKTSADATSSNPVEEVTPDSPTYILSVEFPANAFTRTPLLSGELSDVICLAVPLMVPT